MKQKKLKITELGRQGYLSIVKHKHYPDYVRVCMNYGSSYRTVRRMNGPLPDEPAELVVDSVLLAKITEARHLWITEIKKKSNTYNNTPTGCWYLIKDLKHIKKSLKKVTKIYNANKVRKRIDKANNQ